MSQRGQFVVIYGTPAVSRGLFHFNIDLFLKSMLLPLTSEGRVQGLFSNLNSKKNKIIPP